MDLQDLENEAILLVALKSEPYSWTYGGGPEAAREGEYIASNGKRNPMILMGASNSRQALSRLDDEEKQTVISNDTLSRNPNMSIINESGLWSLVLTSRKLPSNAL